MKNKSSNHKSLNRFKFTLFADRVSSIDIRHNALYHIEHVNADAPEEGETFFHNTIEKWRVLNLTTEYVNFTKKVGNVHTLPQLLHRKDDIINLLMEHIETGNVLFLQPLLELITVLAKDLQEEFYQYFPRILKSLIALLNTKDTDQLEWTLICLAYLFKYLKTYLKRDIIVVFEAVLPLLSDSMPWFIKNFAAESFAFVARDIKDKKKFLRVLVKTVGNKKDNIVGCGRLFFEIIRGVNKQFHSCTKIFLELLLESLDDKTLNQAVYFEILTQTLTDMLEVIHPKNSEVFWSTILGFATAKLHIFKSDSECYALEASIKLIGQAMEHENSSFLTNPALVLVLVHQLFESSLPEHILMVSSKLVVLILTSKSTNIPHEDCVLLVKKILNTSYSSVTLGFVEEAVSSSSFDVVILPNFISQIQDTNDNFLRVLSSICIKKSPLSKNGVDLYSWVKYPMDFGSKTEMIIDKLIGNIDCDIKSILNNPDSCICALACLPHIKSSSMEKLHMSLERLLTDVITFVKNFEKSHVENDKDFANAVFVSCVALETVIHIMSANDLEKFCNENDIVNVFLTYAQYPNYVCCLRIIDLYLTACYRQKSLDLSLFDKLYSSLNQNLKSSFHEIRLLTTHVFSLFEEKIQKLKSTKPEQKDKIEIFSLCFSIESEAPSIEDYRDQLVSFSKMAYGTAQHQLSADAGYESFCLSFALGYLNVNFKLLWNPLKTFIKSYADGMQPAKFWEVFYPCLKQASVNAQHRVNLPDHKLMYAGNMSFLNDVFVSYQEFDDKPDYTLYRIHLWELLQETPSLSETKNRDLTSLLMDFMSNEFEKSTQGNVFIDETVEMDTTQEKSLMEIENEVIDDEENVTNKLSKSTYDTFMAILKVYTNMQNPKAMYMEATLKNLYLEYLMHKNPLIQKIALDCLMKYKNKHWTPYKEHLYNLVDGKKFKDELRTFRIQVDEDSIKPEDREEIIPIILRIIYSKMITNMGIDKKGGSQLRRSLVIRFLFGCEEIELITFTNMAFSVFKTYLNIETSELPQIVSQTVDEIVNIPPKKLIGALRLLDTMREQFTRPGQEKLMLHLLKIVLCIGCLVNGILTQPKTLQIGYSKILKEIRNRCVMSISRFFEQFEGYRWDFQSNIAPIYNVFVWSIVERLPTEGVYSPTALLRLFSVWCQHPQYHPLLNVYKSEHSFTPLHFLIQLLKSNKIHHSVYELCMQNIEKLLTLESSDERPVVDVPESFLVPTMSAVFRDLELKEKLNYGSCLLVPHTSVLVEIIRDKFKKYGVKKLQKRDLLILTRIAEFVYEPEVVDKLLNFSLPILINRVGQHVSEESLQSSIIALSSLLCKSSEPVRYLRSITPLFSQVIPATSRNTLCKALEALANSNVIEVLETISIVKDLNASDAKWIDQPDFEKRIGGYKRIYELLDKQEINVELAALILHNCFFTIRYTDDLSLRNMATSCQQKIAPKLVIQYQDSVDRDYLIKDTILFLIKKSLKIDNEVSRMEGIALLGELVRECSHVPGVFSELYPLTNKADKETDFFENLQHLQLHRRIRAYQKFCSYVKTSKEVPNIKTLTQIIIPLASHYICSEKYLPKHALVDAAIDTIGTVCRLLPWRQYEAILKYYVDKLQKTSAFPKQLIKIVGLVLDAFHFDLSKIGDVDSAMKREETVEDATEVKDEGLDIPEETAEDVADVHSHHIPFERIHVLSPSNARRAVAVINDILNKLNLSSSQIMDHEMQHKKAKSGGSSREQDEIMKLPMALAIVKLLQKLPGKMLEDNIQGIFIKVANFLKSPLINVRTEARDTISKITLSVGTTHLGALLELLSTMLTRGIHVHVLISTVHTVLIALKDSFKIGEIDKHIHCILKVCLNDLFGKASEEKEVAKLGHKAPEAKPSLKSFSTLRIVAENICEPSIVKLVTPFRETAETTHSKKTILKVQTALQNICWGLGTNQNIPLISLLNFVNNIMSGTVAKLTPGGGKRKADDESREQRYKKLRSDCFIITPAPKGKKGVSNIKIRNSAEANSHLIMEFSLMLLHSLLQKDNISEEMYREVINNCSPYLIDSLKSLQVKVATVGLKCITTIWSKKIILPIMKNQIENIAATIFQILHKFSTSGLSKKDDNFHLVSNSFKAVTALIRDVKYHTINMDQMKALLLYAEHDINHHEKQATAFTLLKTIIGAKYKITEIHEIMKKVESLSILSENGRSREEARIVVLTFVMNYPLGNKLVQHIQFYLNQMNYELEHGRKSAIKMLQTFIEKFTEDVLNEHASLMYLSIGMRLVNDSSTDCKILVAECLEQLIQKISLAKRNELFKLNMTLFHSYKPPHIEMAAQLCSRFANVEKQSFKNRLLILLPELNNHLYEQDPNVGRFVKIGIQNNNTNNKIYDAAKDNSFIQVLILLNKICELCPLLFKDVGYFATLDEIAYNCQSLLAHSHSWVRHQAAKYLSMYLDTLDYKYFENITNGCAESSRSCFNSYSALKSLVLDLVSQLIPNAVSSDMADVVCTTLICLLKLVTYISKAGNWENQEERLSVLWIVRVIKSALNSEVTKSPGSTVIRISIFKTLEGQLSDLDSETVLTISKLLLTCIVREINKTDSSADSVREQAMKLGQLLCKSVGNVVYNDILTKVQAKINAKRKERKQKIAQDKLNNPEKAAKRKETLKEKRKDYKRKKVDVLKGRMKRPKLKSVEPVITD